MRRIDSRCSGFIVAVLLLFCSLCRRANAAKESRDEGEEAPRLGVRCCWGDEESNDRRATWTSQAPREAAASTRWRVKYKGGSQEGQRRDGEGGGRWSKNPLALSKVVGHESHNETYILYAAPRFHLRSHLPSQWQRINRFDGQLMFANGSFGVMRCSRCRSDVSTGR